MTAESHLNIIGDVDVVKLKPSLSRCDCSSCKENHQRLERRRHTLVRSYHHDHENTSLKKKVSKENTSKEIYPIIWYLSREENTRSWEKKVSKENIPHHSPLKIVIHLLISQSRSALQQRNSLTIPKGWNPCTSVEDKRKKKQCEPHSLSRLRSEDDFSSTPSTFSTAINKRHELKS